MTRLIGVTHGASFRDPFFGMNIHEIRLPGGKLMQKISKLPKGTKIGMEYLNGEDFKKVKKHMGELQKDLPPSEMAFYEDGTTKSYWENLIALSNVFSHEVIFLEKPDIWFEYNEASVKLNRLMRKWKKIEREEDEGESDYFLRILNLNEDIYRAEIKQNNIFRIGRDEKLLEMIKTYRPDVVIVGVGHSDCWMANPDGLRKRYGIVFEEYTTETLEREKGIPRYEQVFTEKAVPDPRKVFGRKGLERAVNFLEKGRITSGNPDYVGTWDLECPSRGFFEMFTEKEEKDGFVRGRIEDCLGSADFECMPSPGKFDFSKKYRENECAGNVPRGWIEYESEGDGNKGYFHGYFKTHIMEKGFFMRKSSREMERTPINMSMAWYEMRLAGQLPLF